MKAKWKIIFFRRSQSFISEATQQTSQKVESLITSGIKMLFLGRSSTVITCSQTSSFTAKTKLCNDSKFIVTSNMLRVFQNVVTPKRERDYEQDRKNFRFCILQLILLSRIWSFYSGGYEEYHLLGYDAV
jgi:hypothetical protein